MSLNVNEAGLATQIKARSEMLGKSTVNNISSVTTYNLGGYNNKMKQQKDNTNSYFSVDSIWSFAENHLNLSATAYGQPCLHSIAVKFTGSPMIIIPHPKSVIHSFR